MGNVNCLCGGFGEEKKNGVEPTDKKFGSKKKHSSTIVPAISVVSVFNVG
jgi:hypothetical protein